MILKTSKILVKLFGILSPQFIKLTGVLFMLTISPIHLGGKLHPNSLQKLPPLLEKTKRKPTSPSQPTSKRSLCPSWLNLRKRSMSSQSISRATSRQPTLSNLLNLMPKSLSKIPILWKLSRLKKHSLLLMQRKSTKSTTSSGILQRQNLIFK